MFQYFALLFVNNKIGRTSLRVRDHSDSELQLLLQSTASLEATFDSSTRLSVTVPEPERGVASDDVIVQRELPSSKLKIDDPSTEA